MKKETPNPRIPAVTPISSSQTVVAAVDVGSMSTGRSWQRSGQAIPPGRWPSAAEAGRVFLESTCPPWEHLPWPSQFQGALANASSAWASFPPFICGFPITLEATSSKLVPLIRLGGCSLSAGAREHRFPSPLQGGTPSQDKDPLAPSLGWGGKEASPNHTRTRWRRPSAIRHPLCQRARGHLAPQPPASVAVGRPSPGHACEGSPVAHGKVKINIK